ncbi:MAG: RluA family pseudouridine synthase [Gracilibacteraceae bacterium]|jgi:23S rRNA pseudouridine1911/1915/1917 synthase|nr:RluA family pseudouridine synthase [Gracilibacteraceae bacterium]
MISDVLDFCIGEACSSPPLSKEESCELAGKRLDIVLVSLCDLSRSKVQHMIRAGQVTVCGRPAQPGHLLRPADHIRMEIPIVQLSVLPENIPLNIIYEDPHVLVVNKPQGMVVHPATGSEKGTLVNALLFHTQDLSSAAGPLRPGIVHRIDKDTSGILLVAKTDAAHQHLARQLEQHAVERSYRAIVHGQFADSSATIDAPIGRDPRDRRKMTVQHKNARHAVTHVDVIQHLADFTEIRATLETGRIHQIRVHLAWLGHPVAGDPFYGPEPSYRHLKGQLLHAERLGFVHPETGENMCFAVEPPPLYQEILTELGEGVRG